MIRPEASIRHIEVLENLSVPQLREIPKEENLVYVTVAGQDTKTGYPFDIAFQAEHAKGPYIHFRSESRRAFLERGIESHAQAALVDFAIRTRSITGGYFDIHPFYGAIYGTKLTPVAPGFLTDRPSLNESLSMIIYTADNGNKFDPALTHQAEYIGTTFVIPSNKATQHILYMEAANKANPNQASRDQAIVNGLGAKWDSEFERYNGGRPYLYAPTVPIIQPLLDGIRNISGRRAQRSTIVPGAMQMNSQNIAEIIEVLERQGFTDIRDLSMGLNR